MDEISLPFFIGNTLRREPENMVTGAYITLLGEPYYKIDNFDALEPFFISIVSSSDHWLFIASTGGISAGRSSAEHALFPYYTVDKITESSENTGNKAILFVRRDDQVFLWEPLSERQRGLYKIQRNIYKNIPGTAIIFEEGNIDLGLTYRYAWRTSEKYGFVKTTWLINTFDSPCQIEFVDGIQNILPSNIAVSAQNVFSSLLDAYKRSELDSESGLAIFSLSSCLTDLAEPSESLLAATVAVVGLDEVDTLLSSLQLDSFRQGKAITTELEVRGRRGAYFVHTSLELPGGETCAWYLVADVDQDNADVLRMIEAVSGEHADLIRDIEQDIAANQMNLWKIVAEADGLQCSADPLCTAHHFANVMFNVMRGGAFADQYWVTKAAFNEFVAEHNRQVFEENASFFAELPEQLQIAELVSKTEASGSASLIRLSHSYIPLTFSRRHGDPSRPWNQFAIRIKNPDGSRRLDYEGNWRDIFQNWEALAYAFPEFVENMIATFLNATTADGYNPYRITYRGIDWEVPEPNNPWANIGYWSDHQIIYLQKLMEISVRVHPGRLDGYLTRRLFSYANVPYRLKSFTDLLKDPYKTIDFDWDAQGQTEARIHALGSDGRLVQDPDGQIIQVSLSEKLLTLLLAKLANFVPEGGIWMNTQRPEWNDANNALVGKGLSVVTVCYLRRMLAFSQELLDGIAASNIPISTEVLKFYRQVAEILKAYEPALNQRFSDELRFTVMQALGQAGSDYRWAVYQHGLSGEFAGLPARELAAFFELAQKYIEHTLRANRRTDNLYHAYNILHLEDAQATVDHLYEMLEGQVAILSSGLLDGDESVRLLASLRNSAMYLPDQHSYILYPDRDLPGFLAKNKLDCQQAEEIGLFAELADAKDKTLITLDLHGEYHFSGAIRNGRDVNRALAALAKNPKYSTLVQAERGKINALFEATFRHSEFTGRSGTFFAYEGLGSIYWHMVAKLLLAVQETALRYRNEPAGAALRESYHDIRQGLGYNKPPAKYGTFPTDPYSHTPKDQGAKQPGMTGQVKEELLTRLAELGVTIEHGRLVFDLRLLNSKELLAEPGEFTWLDVGGQTQTLALPAGSLAFTFCQTPVILQAGHTADMTVFYKDGTTKKIDDHVLDAPNSAHLFQRDGLIHHLQVNFLLENTAI